MKLALTRPSSLMNFGTAYSGMAYLSAQPSRISLLLCSILRITFAFHFWRPWYLQFLLPVDHIKVQCVVYLMFFKDKLPENFTFVVGNEIIFPVYSKGFFSPFFDRRILSSLLHQSVQGMLFNELSLLVCVWLLN